YLAPLIGGEDQEFSRLRDELVIDFTMRLSERAHELEQLWGESTWDEFKVQIHKLAGSALSYGHDAISEHAGAIDRAWPERYPRAFEHLLALMRGVEEPDETAAPEGIIGDSVAMREVYRRVRLAAKSEVTVLLTGASGTGKELVARAIHSSSSRAAGPLIEVNCSAIPETLLESELFGHAKGAFTGAGRDKSGLLEAASGGTLFLDEIEDISLAMQVKLLRALEQRTIRRVGETQVRPIDTRIVAATNKDLEELVENGRIRDDFYYRVRVFDIRLPDLTDRSGDIPMLVQHFVTRFAQEQHRIAPTVSSAAMQRLLAYPWPGNVRELRNAIEHAFVVAGREIGLDALPPTLQREAEPAPEPATNAPNPADEREHIIAVLREVNGHRERAAEKLGYSRVTLWKKIKKYGLQS
ncbi:MAG: sigma-54 dependent transcriptional regulator, partial [Myxococcota bacterium]